jgi:hypothetical protein
VPGAADLLSVLSYHRYDTPAPGDTVLAGLRERAEAAGIRVEMLEFTGGTYEDLFQDLTLANASAWQLFMIARKHAADEPSLSVLVDADFVDPAAPTFSLSERGRYLAAFFKPVELGAVRIGAASDNGKFAPVAFRNPDGRVVILIKAERGGEVEVAGLPAGTYAPGGVFETGEVEAAEPLHVEPGASVRVEVASKGVLSLVQGAQAP